MADEIIHNLWLGDLDDANEVCRAEYDHVINVLGIIEPDDETGKVDVDVVNAISFLIKKMLDVDKRILVHCGAGMERSPLAVAWYLWKHEDFKSLDDAYRFIKSKRQLIMHCGHWVSWGDVHGKMLSEL